jgi:histidyl-tRNA synthetase
MSSKMQPVRGTKDLLADEYRVFSTIHDVARQKSKLFGFDEVATPIFEFTEVFKRTLGEDSDVVGKEMYSFEDRNGESLTLRPEFTAGIARALISNGLAHQLPLKYFSCGPVFRYERPQKGRQRQFHQVNFESIGNEHPHADVELIALGYELLVALGIEQSITLELNSLGDSDSRMRYRTALVEYFSRYVSDLSEDSQKRLKNNPLRILDSKNERDREIAAEAPLINEHYSDEARTFFDTVENGLTRLAIPYSINRRLVRGLDYYCHTAFEFTTDQLGAQNAVLAGGRYDGLVKLMGGPDTPAVGFAGGMERLMALSAIQTAKVRPVALIPIGENAESEALKLAHVLRQNAIPVEWSYSGNLKTRMKKANHAQAIIGLIFGDDELSSNQIKLKEFDTGGERVVSSAQLMDEIGRYI